jgi:hypothetical protein
MCLTIRNDRGNVLVVLVDPVGGIEGLPVVHAEHRGVVDEDVDWTEGRASAALPTCSAPASFARSPSTAVAVPPAAAMSATMRPGFRGAASMHHDRRAFARQPADEGPRRCRWWTR